MVASNNTLRSTKFEDYLDDSQAYILLFAELWTAGKKMDEMNQKFKVTGKSAFAVEGETYLMEVVLDWSFEPEELSESGFLMGVGGTITEQ